MWEGRLLCRLLRCGTVARSRTIIGEVPRIAGTSGFFVHTWTIFPFLPRIAGTSGFFVHTWTIFPFLPRNAGTSGFFVHAWNFPPIKRFRAMTQNSAYRPASIHSHGYLCSGIRISRKTDQHKLSDGRYLHLQTIILPPAAVFSPFRSRSRASRSIMTANWR